MNKSLFGLKKVIVMLVIVISCLNITAYAQEETEDVSNEQQSFNENNGFWEEPDDAIQYVDGIYNVGTNARANMAGVIRLYQGPTKLSAAYSTDYSTTVNRIGVKNIKLQYKGSLGIWHTIITLDDRYATNAAVYQGSFSCSGVVGRVYRVKGTHYVINGAYTESRDNVTGELTFR